MRRKLAAGNWKMNGTPSEIGEISAIIAAHSNPQVDILLCPPATMIARASVACTDHAIAMGGQDCHANPHGAHTGDISAEMLKAAGATYVLNGHSERRTDHHETDPMVCAKAEAAYSAGLIAVICIGESEQERETGTTLTVIDTQLAGSVPATATAANTVIAYEPVWAIGTGKVPTLDQIGEVHNHIRAKLNARFQDANDMRLLYGGSVKASNADDIFGVADVDGALVGGASLKASDFSPIIAALEKS